MGRHDLRYRPDGYLEMEQFDDSEISPTGLSRISAALDRTTVSTRSWSERLDAATADPEQSSSSKHRGRVDRAELVSLDLQRSSTRDHRRVNGAKVNGHRPSPPTSLATAVLTRPAHADAAPPRDRGAPPRHRTKQITGLCRLLPWRWQRPRGHRLADGASRVRRRPPVLRLATAIMAVALVLALAMNGRLDPGTLTAAIGDSARPGASQIPPTAAVERASAEVLVAEPSSSERLFPMSGPTRAVETGDHASPEHDDADTSTPTTVVLAVATSHSVQLTAAAPEGSAELVRGCAQACQQVDNELLAG